MDALFYPISYAQSQVVQLVYGMVAAVDIVDFPDEDGGDVDQALAVPFLPGMDAIVVTQARLVLRSAPKDLDIDNYSVRDNGSNGVFVVLDAAAHLKKIETAYTNSGASRVVLCSATKSSGAQPEAGVPLFVEQIAADGSVFASVGPMYGKSLGGMNVDNLSGERRLLTLPGVLGDAWLLQIASGNDPTALNPAAIKPAINRVVLEAAPRNLSVVLAPDAEALMLWKNPGVLLPEAGDQEISFAPLAQKHLSTALQNVTAGAAALPLPLRFHSDCGAAVAIVAKSLVAEYQVQPFGSAAKTFSLRGDFAQFMLSAPAGLAPLKSAMRLTVKLLGRELNAASPEPTLALPSNGLRVGNEHWIAAASAVAPRSGESSGSVVRIASVRIYLASIGAAEVVLELRSDIANSPGAAVAAPLVKQLDADFIGWLEFELPTALPVVAGNAPIWLALRTNKGEVRWFAAPGAIVDAAALNSVVSIDRGATWGAANPQLNMPQPLLTQLLHEVDDPIAAPIIRLQRGATILQNNIFANPQKKSAREYTLDTATLPSAVHTALATKTGAGRVDSEFLLFSRSAIDVVVEALTISYDPFTAANSGSISSGG